jgi:hypothetical protein
MYSSRKAPLMLMVGLIVGLFCTACAVLGIDDESDGNSSSTAGKADGVTPDETWPPETLDASQLLAPNYALIIDTWLSTASDTEGAEPEEWTAQFAAAVSVQFIEGEPQFNVSPCRVILPNIDGRVVEITDTTLQSVEAGMLNASVHTVEKTVRLATGRGALIAGADLSDILNDELPTDANDDRITDVDGDGKPGMTIEISGHRVYVGMRYRFDIDGELTQDQTIEGEAGVRIDLEVYGDSIPFINVKRSLDKALGKLNLLDERHAFVMTPLLDPTDACEQVIKRLDVARSENVDEDTLSD